MQIISAKYLLTFNSALQMNGAIAIENGEIIEVGSFDDLKKNYPNATQEVYSQHVLMPGLINAHTHLDLGGHKNYPFDPVRNIVPEVHFAEWLISCIDYKKQADPKNIREAIAEGLESSIEWGTTCVGEMGDFEGIFPLLKKLGMRSVVFQQMLHSATSQAQDRYESALGLVEKYQAEADPLLRVGLAPYSAYTVSRNILRLMSSYAASTHIPMMIHAAESFAEMELFYNSTGEMITQLFPHLGWKDDVPPVFQKTPIAYLDEIGFLATKPALVGCVQTTPDDHERIKKSESKVIITPRSNNFLKLGAVALDKMHAKGICIALATDGLSSNSNLSLWDELRFLNEQLAESGSDISSEELLKMVTVNAAQAINVYDLVGSFAIGKRADYIVVKVGEEEIADIYSHLIENTKGYHITQVAVDGKILKSAD